MVPHFKLISLAGLILLVALATPALAGSLFKWTSEDGSVAFTDDPKYRAMYPAVQRLFVNAVLFSPGH